MPLPRPLEKDIQAGICDYLALRGHFFWRQNTTPIFDKNRGGFRAMPKHSFSGLPDIMLVQFGTGRLIGLEVKRPRGKQSEGQELFMMRLRNSGGEYHLVHSIDEVIALGL